MLELWGNRQALRWLTAADIILYLYILYWFWKLQRADEALRVALNGPNTPKRLLFPAVAALLGIANAACFYAFTAYLDAALSSVPIAIGAALAALLLTNALSTLLLSALLRAHRRASPRSASGPSPASVESMFASLSERSGRKQVLQFTLVFSALLLIIIAVMRPQTTGKQHKVKRQGTDIVFAIDLSKSMLAEDLKPNRLQVARNEVHAVLDQLKGDRVGLVVFTATALPQCPLTADYGVLHSYIDAIEPALMPRGGTAIGRAIDESRYLLTGKNPRRDRIITSRDPNATTDQKSPSDSTKRDSIIVLFSDGEDHETDPQRAALAARQDNIRIITVGLGTASGSNIPKLKDGLRSGIETHQGAPIHTRMDEPLLRDIASSTSGLYIPYSGPGSVAQPLLEQIERMDRMQYENDLTRYRDDHFPLLLWPATLLLLLASSLGDRRGFQWPWRKQPPSPPKKPSRNKKPQKTQTPQQTTKQAAASLLLASCAAASALSQQACFDDSKPLFERPNASVESGNQLLNDRKINAALDHYRSATSELPKHPLLEYNFGVATFFASDITDPNVESPEDALLRAATYLERATRTPLSDSETHFRIHYNLGNTYLKLAQRLSAAAPPTTSTPNPSSNPTDPARAQQYFLQAADSFQYALSIYPDDPDARYNLELALALMIPPCSKFEDKSEDDDSPATLADRDPPNLIELAQAKKPTHTLCGGDDDLFPLPPGAGPGDRIHVTATFSSLPQRKNQEPLDDSARLEFAQIQLAIVDSQGNTLSGINAEAQTIPAQDLGPDLPDGKPVKKISRQIPRITLASLPQNSPPDGPLFVRVRGLDNAEATYNIRIDHRPPCQKLEDPFEDNNTLANAKALTPDLAIPRDGSTPLPPTGDHYALHFCPQSDDWFSIRSNPGDALFLDLSPSKDALTQVPPKLQMELYVDEDPTPIRTAALDPNGMTLQDGLLNIEVFDLDPLMAQSHHLRLRVFPTDDQQEGDYTLTVYHYPPCAAGPSGDDPLEPNNNPSSRATLDPKQKFIRYLRNCQAAPDYFLAEAQGKDAPPEPPAPPTQPPGAGPDTTAPAPPEKVGFNAHIEYDPRFGDLSFSSRDPETQNLLADGKPGRSQTPKKQVKTIAHDGALAGQQFQLDVQGDPGFYSLYLLNNDEQSQCNNPGGGGGEGPKDPQNPGTPTDDPPPGTGQGGNEPPEDPPPGQDPPQDPPPPGGSGGGPGTDGEQRRQELTEDLLEELERRDRGIHRLDPETENSDPLNDW